MMIWASNYKAWPYILVEIHTCTQSVDLHSINRMVKHYSSKGVYIQSVPRSTMSYVDEHQAICQLCSVSFDISRIRRPDEPESAS